jgi:predicted metal-dependent hydrolase
MCIIMISLRAVEEEGIRDLTETETCHRYLEREHRRYYERGMDVDKMVSSLRTHAIGDALTRLGQKAQWRNSVPV